jgi:hypothetical protein
MECAIFLASGRFELTTNYIATFLDRHRDSGRAVALARSGATAASEPHVKVSNVLAANVKDRPDTGVFERSEAAVDPWDFAVTTSISGAHP